MQKFLVIQTAFIGDVVLATALTEKLHAWFPDAQIDFLVRKGNEGLLAGHPWLHEVLVWDKREGKLKNLWLMTRRIRRNGYDKVINVQRFAATGLLTACSGAKQTIGFDKNPMSRWFTRRIPHVISAPVKPGAVIGGPTIHEIQRNQALIAAFTDGEAAKPRLYPTAADEAAVAAYKSGSYITISPASVWFTKQYPREKWAEFVRRVPGRYTILLLGAPSDRGLCESLVGARDGVVNLAGRLSFLQSAALMRDARMNYVNDSAPMHFASAVDASVTAVYCSTLPAFGFGPLSGDSHIVEIKRHLDCRPCGLHGYRACPLGHFNCAYQIEDIQLLETLTGGSLSHNL
ncbi:MAG TPA: glycosyltransferase family 9 protein [Puia sp.]|nr:glycosyltransferase family 9 protein [Puia sp.]